MIPIHDISISDKKVIRMNELVSLTHYDSSEAHRHNYFEFFVFLKGNGTHLIDFIAFPIQSFSVHIVAPGQVHQLKRELDTNGFVFLFELNFFHESKLIENFLFDHMCLDVNENSPSYHFDPSFNKELTYLVSKAWEEYNSQNEFKNLIVQNQLNQLLLYCMRNKTGSLKETDGSNNALYVGFRRLLHAEFKTKKKVKEYADQLNVSEKFLNDVVFQRSGETVSSLIQKQLILEAKRLLNTGISAKEVSYELNFVDPGHFSKFFKNQIGLSPSEFKNVHV